jgi:hypothetical protein
MGEARVAAAVLAMLDECDLRARDAFIEAVKRFESWRMTDAEVWRRIRQAARPRRHVRDAGRRHFAGDWALIAIRIVTFYGGPDLVSDLCAEAKLEGKREREEARLLEHHERRGPKRVPAPASKRRASA